MDALTELRLRRDAGDLTPDQYADALVYVTVLPAPHEWRRFVSRAAAALGTTALVAGVVYLVAWNWGGLGRWSKLGLASGAVLGAAALASGLGLDRLPGRLAGAASCGFAGGLFVLYTQVYQTGADPWSLFAAFALVCAPYALATGLPAVAAAGVMSAQVAVLLGWIQLHPWEYAAWGPFSIGWALASVPLLVGLDRLWPSGVVPRAAALLGVGVPAALATGAVAMRTDRLEALVAFAIAFLGAHLIRRDVFPVAWGVLGVVVVVATFVGRETADALEEVTFLLLAVVVGVLGAVAAAWLRFLHRRSA